MKNFISEMLPYMVLFAMLFTASSCAQKKMNKEGNVKQLEKKLDKKYENAIFADACFWCVESVFESIEGVHEVLSGYAGGKMKNPTYRNHGKHAEAVKVYYDSSIVSYKDLVDAYFDGHSHGLSPDRGPSYRAVIFPDNHYQEQIVSDRLAKETVKFKQEIMLYADANWHVAEDYHQDYVKRYEAGESVANVSYVRGESIPRRERFKKSTSVRLKKDWKKELDNEEYHIMVKKGTERPFSSPLNSEKRVGVYVSASTGDILFRSADKFNSGTGWPSFDDATDKVSLGPAEQGGYEVIEKSTGHHLGHLFLNENFTDENKRYCINGDALEFIPDEL